jgi:beta-glucosidase
MLDGADQELPEITYAANRQVPEDVAVAGVVLLKDEGALPLGQAALADLAVSGPAAASLLVGGGGSAQSIPPDGERESPIEKLEERRAAISYAIGYDTDGHVLDGHACLPGSTPCEPGFLRTQGTGSGSIDPAVDFTGQYAFPAGSGEHRWQGEFTAPEAGAYRFMIQVSGLGSASRRRGNTQVANLSFGILPAAGRQLTRTSDGLNNAIWDVTLAEGETVRLEVFATFNQSMPGQVRLHYLSPSARLAGIDAAAAQATESHTALVFAYNAGTEGADRPSLHARATRTR